MLARDQSRRVARRSAFWGTNQHPGVADAVAEFADVFTGRLYPANRDFSGLQDKSFIINDM
jgi:hypothetical protein